MQAQPALGFPYYYNARTGESTYNRPPVFSGEPVPTTDWHEVFLSNGASYFFNEATRQTSWRVPEEVKEARSRPPPLDDKTAAMLARAAASGAAVAPQYASAVAEALAKHGAPARDGNGQRLQALAAPAARPSHGDEDDDDDVFFTEDDIVGAARAPPTAEAEAAYVAMLKEHNLRPSSTWTVFAGVGAEDPRATCLPLAARERLFKALVSELKVDKERERRAALQAEAERKLQEDQRAAESRRSAAGRADALAAFQALLVESVHDAGASWSATWPRLREDPQGRGSSALLDPRDAEDAFRTHVRHLEETAARAFAQLLDERVGPLLAHPTGDRDMDWEAVTELIEQDPRFSAFPFPRERKAHWQRWLAQRREATGGVEGPDTKRLRREDA
ncbi:hypothetical protein QBZ16_002822 [Prototheca wickerhamii]|uniref:WW domain-containing protein n=1 Tax=Prototheca wickerhamii TaxID=3111 RepID=A0AAD9IIL7_PROWI|nr:hypothetical protein QBZ16_002822 [Prototheca wickerhamii]